MLSKLSQAIKNSADWIKANLQQVAKRSKKNSDTPFTESQSSSFKTTNPSGLPKVEQRLQDQDNYRYRTIETGWGRPHHPEIPYENATETDWLQVLGGTSKLVMGGAVAGGSVVLGGALCGGGTVVSVGSVGALSPAGAAACMGGAGLAAGGSSLGILLMNSGAQEIKGSQKQVKRPRSGSTRPLSNQEARAAAKRAGFKETKDYKFDSHGQLVFKKGRKYISPDKDQHNGGVWKLFNRKERKGTLDQFLKIFKF